MADDTHIRLIVEFRKTVDMNDSDGWTPQLSMIKTSSLNPAQAHHIANVCNSVEKFRSTRLANQTSVQWIITITDTRDAENIVSKFALDEYQNLPDMMTATLTITLTRY
ncbi:hypothetical protein EJ419_06275 [Alloscardovia theropitheci]|uniref:Uncharacterized protein n=1 Tax=Alloscardovia theropitheci TaxID=2496842 RepID=A0A4R0QS00_9BIFI|nr:hypothetical protein [Alloscardovia theropitheci]TCD53855.1 hypothetical protein EJ419_06275 [Alloscardovia theropitheci]